MTDEERTACSAFIKQYIERKQAQGEWDPDPVGLMRVAYGAACEAKHKHVVAAKVFREMIDAERTRSAKLIQALDYFAHDGQDNHVAQNAIAEYEASRD